MSVADITRGELPVRPLATRARATRAGVVRLEVSGELDLATTPQLELELRRARARSRSVEIDASGVTFIDVVGLRVLLRAVSRGRVALVGTSPEVDRLVALLGDAAG